MAWRWTAKDSSTSGMPERVNTVRKYDPKTGKLLAEVPAYRRRQPARAAGRRCRGRLTFLAPVALVRSRDFPAGGRAGAAATRSQAARAAAIAAFRAKYPPTTPMIVGQIEEVRLDEPAHELYCADSYLGGRVMVFDMDTFAFKRGWGAYGHKLSEITIDDKDRKYTPGGPKPKEFRNHLTLKISKDGLVYAADRWRTASM